MSEHISEEKFLNVLERWFDSHPALTKSQFTDLSDMFQVVVTPSSKLKRRRPSKPRLTGVSVGFCERYRSWVYQEEYGLVVRALRNIGIIHSIESIAEETRLSKNRVRYVITYMLLQEKKLVKGKDFTYEFKEDKK